MRITLPAIRSSKPKAKAKSLQAQTNSWKQLEGDKAMEEGEEENKEDGACVDPENASEKRHFAKARKFGRMMKKGLIPDEILTLYRDASSKQKQPRLFRTELVNRFFKRTKAGEYGLCMIHLNFNLGSATQTKLGPLRRQRVLHIP